MERIILKPLKNRKQLRSISFQKVLSAGFTDDSEKYFTITFETEDGEKQDLTIVSETRTPRVYLSNYYR